MPLNSPARRSKSPCSFERADSAHRSARQIVERGPRLALLHLRLEQGGGIVGIVEPGHDIAFGDALAFLVIELHQLAQDLRRQGRLAPRHDIARGIESRAADPPPASAVTAWTLTRESGQKNQAAAAAMPTRAAHKRAGTRMPRCRRARSGARSMRSESNKPLLSLSWVMLPQRLDHRTARRADGRQNPSQQRDGDRP